MRWAIQAGVKGKCVRTAEIFTLDQLIDNRCAGGGRGWGEGRWPGAEAARHVMIIFRVECYASLIAT